MTDKKDDKLKTPPHVEARDDRARYANAPTLADIKDQQEQARKAAEKEK
jgi:hypothetical protein